MSGSPNVLEQIGSLGTGLLERANNRVRGLATGPADRLRQQAEIQTLRRELDRRPETFADQLKWLNQYNTAVQTGKVGDARATSEALSILTPARGQLINQDDKSYQNRLGAETNSQLEILRGRAGLARELIGDTQAHELTLQAGQDRARQEAIEYARSENAAERDLMKQQIANSKTMRLLNSILGAGAFAAAMFA